MSWSGKVVFSSDQDIYNMGSVLLTTFPLCAILVIFSTNKTINIILLIPVNQGLYDYLVLYALIVADEITTLVHKSILYM